MGQNSTVGIPHTREKNTNFVLYGNSMAFA